MKRFKDWLKTEDAVPANAMGTSSSTAGSGGIDTFDPMLLKKKKKDSILKGESLSMARKRNLPPAPIQYRSQNEIANHDRQERYEYYRHDDELPLGPLKREEILALRRIIRSDDRMRWFWSSARIWAGWLLGVPAAVVATWQLLKLFGFWGGGSK